MTNCSDSLPDLCRLVQYEDVTTIRSCLEKYPTLIHRVRWSGIGPLHRAVGNNDVDMVKLLLEYGANVNARAAWGWYTPIHLACKRGEESMIRLLLDHGAEWNIKDKHHKTPLQWGVRAGKASIVYRVDQMIHARDKIKREEKIESRLHLTSLCF